MKLIKCYVSSFGKLKNFSYEFSQGLNQIKEDNGWGKSTLATFIKAMFYGLDGSNKRSLSDNERKKYKPWNTTETFGGNVWFEWGENQYIIERYFGNKESEDTIKLTDAKTGKVFTNTQNLGRRIFEIDEEGFLSTTYFSQKDFEIKSNTSITAKFNSMCESSDTDSFDRAVAKLEQKAKSYKYSGDRGLIPDLRRELYAINDQIERSRASSDTVKILKEQVNELELKGKEIQSRADQLTKRVAIAAKAEAARDKIQRYKKLNLDREKLVKDKIAAEEVLQGNHVSELEVSPYEHKAREIDNLSEKIKSINYDLSLLEQSENSQKNNKKSNVFYAFAGTFSAVSLILFSVFILVLGVSSFLPWLFLVAFVCSVITIGVYSKGKKDVNKKQTPYSLMTNAKKEELGKCLRLKNQYQSEIDEFISKFALGDGFDRLTALTNVKKVAEVYAVICSSIKAIDLEIEELQQSKQELENGEISNENIAVLNVELRRVQDEYTRNSIDLASKRSSIKIHEENAYKLVDLENKKAECLEKLAKYEEDLKILTLTIKHLKQADENLKAKYRAPLTESLNKYLSFINEGVTANIDLDLTVTVQENNGEKSTEYYSKGYQNLFEICKRFALTDVLFKAEKPFIILDDPFYNLDDIKVKGAIELIKKLSQEYQIIYFICHESRRA